MADNIIVNLAADNIRILSAAAVEMARCGHPGGAMGGADFMNILYSEFLKFDPSDMAWPFRDRFFLDPGHMSALLYSQLALFGNFDIDDLKKFRQWGSPTPGHPEKNLNRGIENTSGPLGQGHTMAVGAAISAKFLAARFGDWIGHKIYTYISDGGIQEEISQGAGRIAGTLGLDNLIMFFDSNNVQLSTETWEVTTEDTSMKYKSWGWEVLTVNGNDATAIREALVKANLSKGKPTLIIGNTIMGKGAVDDNGNNFEGKCSTHGMPLSESGASFKKTILNLGGDPDDPFQIFPEVFEYYKKVKENKIIAAAEKKKQISEWEKANHELSAKLKIYLSGKITKIDYTAIIQKENVSTRVASANVLSYYAQHVGNMIVSSADLSNSDKTDGFLKNTRAFRKGDFSGSFLQAGVSELTMAAITNGMVLHGGVIAACATFFVFSDYMKPAIRLSALMELPVKFIWTHDAFRVGEDGPTHQPVEQEAQIRLLENLKNHHGENSLLVLRPADAIETTIAWKMALENTGTPTGLIFSRQNIKDVPALKGSTRYKDAIDAQKGAYIVKETIGKPDIILVSNGSEVSTCYDCAGKLSDKGINVRVVSAISEGLFRNQPLAYQKEVIPDNIPIFGLTAGLPITLKGLTGSSGKVFGMESFGFSAPYAVLDEKLGFTPDNLVLQVERYLEEYHKS